MADELSIQEIARLAGVSKTTVSRVINKRPDVKPATRERVEAVIREHHFTPNARAQAFSRKRTMTVAMVFPNDEAHTLSNPYYAELIQGVLEKARETGYHVILSYFLNDDCFQLARQRQCDGFLIITPDGSHKEKLRALMDLELPVVSTARVPGLAELHYVSVDEYGASFKMMEHLLSLGHRRIAMINGPRPLYSSNARLRGYQAALKKYGVPFDSEIVTWGDTTPESGRDNARRLLEKDRRLTAMFVCGDMMSLGARLAIDEAGLRMPEDVSLVSTDATVVSACLNTPLTSAMQPTRDRGEKALQMLIDLIEDRKAPESITLPMDIVVRKSTAVPARPAESVEEVG